MNIRQKTLMVVGVSLIISALMNFFVIKTFVYPKFLQIEREAAKKDAQRAVEAIASELTQIELTSWDYSTWDDTYNFVASDLRGNYAEVNLRPESLKNVRMDIVEIFDAQKQSVYRGGYDKFAEEVQPRYYSWHFSDAVNLDYIGVIDGSNLLSSGITKSPDGLVMFATRPILMSDGSGPSVGAFFFGRFLDNDLVKTVKERIKVDVELSDLETMRSAFAGEEFDRILGNDAPAISDINTNDPLVTYWPLRDYRGEPIAVLRAYTERDVSESGRDVVLASVVGLGVAGLFVMAAIAALLQWLLVGPLIKLTRHVVRIGRSGDLAQRVFVDRRDEIGTLSQEFDRMLGRLAEARDQLLEQSYKSGIAEMASGVLHNMRNQLMPVNMRLGRLRESVVAPSQGKLEKALDEIKRNNGDPERVEKLANYVALVIGDVVRRQDGFRQQLADVSHDLCRIEEILLELDRFSHARAQLEAVSVGDLVDQTIGLLPEFPDLRVRIKVDPMLKKRHAVMSVGFMLKHVLHNLFINAFEAIMATGKNEGTIEVALAFKTVDGLAMADLQVRDDGIGIAHENIKEIFVRGFTTKQKGGRRGTGLHWCANRVAAMGGKLYAESPGVNRGATFHVLLPLVAAPPMAAQ